MAIRETWILNLEGKGSLIAPDSKLIPLRYHKVAELIWRLSLAPNHQLDREDLAKELWPNFARIERMTSLRQSLKQGRDAMGKDAILGDRKVCLLASYIDLRVLESPADSPGLQPQSEWPIGQPEISNSENNLSGMLRLMIESPEQVPVLSPNQLDTLVAHSLEVPLQPIRSGWISYWRAMSFFRTGPSKSLRLLELALQEGLKNRDHQLVGYSTFWLGCGYILRSEVGRANKLVIKVRSLVPVRDELIESMLLSLEAHIQLHRGNFEVAIEQLLRIEWGNEQAQVTSKGLISLYQAVSGLYGDAENGLNVVFSAKESQKTSQSQGYAALALCTMETLDLRSERFRESSESQLELYTRELLLVRARDRKKPHLGDGHYARAKYLRRSIGLAYSAWDRERFRPQS